MSKRRWSVKSSYGNPNYGESGSSIGLPTFRLVAWLQARLPTTGSMYERREVVNHDDEMRAWGRPDWIRYPTDEERLAAEAARAYVIPVVRPGESVRVPFAAGSREGTTE